MVIKGPFGVPLGLDLVDLDFGYTVYVNGSDLVWAALGVRASYLYRRVPFRVPCRHETLNPKP